MGQELGRARVNLPSLPAWLPRLALGTVTMPNQPERAYLPAGLKLTDEQRTELERSLRLHKAMLDTQDRGGQRAAALASMILAYPMSGGAGEHSARARGEAYRDALDDQPAWAVIEAIRRWNRGSCGDQNYNFAPAPAVLRLVVVDVIAATVQSIQKIEAVLSAKSLDETLELGNQTAADRDYVVGGFAKLKVDLSTAKSATPLPSAPAAEDSTPPAIPQAQAVG